MVKKARRYHEERLHEVEEPDRPPRIIVADDDGDLRLLIVRALNKAGYDVAEASTGVELVDQISDALLSDERTARPDVIVSDIRMPGLFSLDILASLREAEWRTAMIVMTAYSDADTRKRVAELGATLFEKPFAVDDLLAAVRDAHHGWRGRIGPTDTEGVSTRRAR